MTHIAEVPEMGVGLFLLLLQVLLCLLCVFVQCSQRDLITVGLSVTIPVN